MRMRWPSSDRLHYYVCTCTQPTDDRSRKSQESQLWWHALEPMAVMENQICWATYSWTTANWIIIHWFNLLSMYIVYAPVGFVLNGASTCLQHDRNSSFSLCSRCHRQCWSGVHFTWHVSHSSSWTIFWIFFSTRTAHWFTSFSPFFLLICRCRHVNKLTWPREVENDEKQQYWLYII